MKFIEAEMCVCGGTHMERTGTLTNCEWIQETLCSQVVPHKHVPLQGKVYDYRQNDTVRFTSLANEHPQQWYTTVTLGFKDALAKGLTFSEVQATRQNHLEDFTGSFCREHGRTRTTAGA